MLFASAAFWLDELVEIFLSVVVGEFGSGFDTFAGKDEHFIVWSDGFTVRPAGVIDVSSHIGGDIPVDRFVRIHLKEIFALVFIRFFLADGMAEILDNTDSLWDVFFGKKSLAAQRAPHRKLIPAWGIFGQAFFHLIEVRPAGECKMVMAARLVCFVSTDKNLWAIVGRRRPVDEALRERSLIAAGSAIRL